MLLMLFALVKELELALHTQLALAVALGIKESLGSPLAAAVTTATTLIFSKLAVLSTSAF